MTSQLWNILVMRSVKVRAAVFILFLFYIWQQFLVFASLNVFELYFSGPISVFIYFLLL